MSKAYHNRHMLSRQLLHDQKFTLDAKTIKKIVVTGKCYIRIKKSEGLSMTIMSHDSFACRIEGNTLFIDPFSVYTWCCCVPINFSTPRSRIDFSDMWRVNALFIINSVTVNGSGTIYIEEGFDKSLHCIKSGRTGNITLNNLYVADLKCNLSGGGKIICIDSNCFDFTGSVNGIGKIVAPKITNRANCSVNGIGQVDCTVHKGCELIKNIKSFGKINIKKIDGISTNFFQNSQGSTGFHENIQNYSNNSSCLNQNQSGKRNDSYNRSNSSDISRAETISV